MSHQNKVSKKIITKVVRSSFVSAEVEEYNLQVDERAFLSPKMKQNFSSTKKKQKFFAKSNHTVRLNFPQSSIAKQQNSII
jgi:hypothetical protein